jgi:hypothetical protein
MTDADDRLAALFAEDEPPARDPAFSAAVMQEIARRRFQTDVALLSGAAAIGGVVLWVLWPTLAPALAVLGESLMPVMACASLAITGVVLLDSRVTAAARLKHD